MNATLRLGDTPETISLDRACELLAERRNADPSTARPRKAAKKVAKKAAKKPAKKATAKKTAGAQKREAVAKGAKVNAALAQTAKSDEE